MLKRAIFSIGHIRVIVASALIRIHRMMVLLAASDMQDIALPSQYRNSANGRSDRGLLPAASDQTLDDPGNKKNNTCRAQEIGRAGKTAGSDSMRSTIALAVAEQK